VRGGVAFLLAMAQKKSFGRRGLSLPGPAEAG
jgi:hypothetical protein